MQFDLNIHSMYFGYPIGEVIHAAFFCSAFRNSFIVTWMNCLREDQISVREKL